MSDYRVILIKGGAGTGKTTLVTSFVREKAIPNLKWISLDESCNNVFLFWNYFIKAVGGCLEASKQELIFLYNCNFEKSSLKKLLTLLINAVNNPEDIFIVLDDFYYITDSFLLHTIEFFLKNLPDNVYVILLTRQEPLLYLGALNMDSKLLLIDENDLKLSKKLGIKFLKDTLKVNFRQEILDFINDLCEGWIGGLQLVAAGAVGKNEDDIMKLSFQNRFVTEYLTKEIYELLSTEEKQFVVVTSILQYFNQEIAQQLLEEIDFKKVMDSLQKKNILIICLDEEKGIYRYHNILKEYLKEKFKDIHKETQIQFHIKAADIMRNLGDFDQCIQQLILAGDYSSVMKFILEFPGNMALFIYGDRIPEKFIIQNPDFAYQYFFYNYANLEFEKCKEIYDVLKINRQGDSTFSAFKFSSMFVEDTFKLNEIEVMTTSEIDKLSLKETTKAFILMKDASLLYARCRYGEALNSIDKAMSYSSIHNNFYIHFFSFGIKSQILEDMGEFNKCEFLYEKMNKILKSNADVSIFNTSFYIGITGIYLKQMDLKNAEKCLENAGEYISSIVLSVDRGYRYNLAEYKFIIGETEEALKLVRELMNMKTYNNITFMASLLKYVFRLNKFYGELVVRFKADYESMDKSRRNLDSRLLYANILFREGKIEEAIKLTDEILKYSRRNEIKLKMVQASLFKINILYCNSMKKREIINLFREALFYSCEDKILQPYYFESEIVCKFVMKYESDFYDNLSYAEKMHYKQIINICKIETKSILSKREIEVLNEIAAGASNREIAEHLYISLATVKSHIINIYSKLGVNSRVRAIKAAKRYGHI